MITCNGNRTAVKIIVVVFLFFHGFFSFTLVLILKPVSSFLSIWSYTQSHFFSNFARFFYFYLSWYAKNDRAKKSGYSCCLFSHFRVKHVNTKLSDEKCTIAYFQFSLILLVSDILFFVFFSLQQLAMWPKRPNFWSLLCLKLFKQTTLVMLYTLCVKRMRFKFSLCIFRIQMLKTISVMVVRASINTKVRETFLKVFSLRPFVVPIWWHNQATSEHFFIHIRHVPNEQWLKIC